jgi:hypothetical protein
MKLHGLLSRALLSVVACIPCLHRASSAIASPWLPLVGQPATATTTGFATLSGNDLRFAQETAAGQPVVFVASTPETAVTLAPGSLPSSTARQSYRANWRIRATRFGPLGPSGLGHRIVQTPDAALRATMYLQNVDPVTVPNGAPAPPIGLSLHVQSNLAGAAGRSPLDVSLLQTQFQQGRATVAFDRWTDLELEFVRAAPGRLVLSVNGQVVSGVDRFDAGPVTDAGAAGLFTLRLPAWPGIRWDIGEQSLVSDEIKIYDRQGRIFDPSNSVARMVMIPPSLSLPWSSYEQPQGGHDVTFIESSGGGVQTAYRRAAFASSIGATTTWQTVPMNLHAPNLDGWSTIVLRELLVPTGAQLRVRTQMQNQELEDSRFDLVIRDGFVWQGSVAIVPWPSQSRCAMLLHSKLENGQLQRRVSVIDLSAEELSAGTIKATNLGDMQMNEIVDERLIFEVQSPMGHMPVELGGFAVARWVDAVLTDSYVNAFATGITPRIVAMSRFTAAQFAGYETDMVPGRPVRIEPAAMVGESSEPMYLIAAGRSGRRLSDFARSNMTSLGEMRGMRWFLHAGFVNELSNQLNDTYFVDSDDNARRKAAETGALLQEMLQVTGAVGHRWIISSATPTLHTRNSIPKTAAFAYYDQIQQRLARQFDATERVQFARIGNQLTLAQQDALLSGDLVHYSAVGDMAYASVMFAELATLRVRACSVADVGSEGAMAQSDGQLDNNDFIVFINQFFERDLRADMGSQGGTSRGDGLLDNNDFIVFIGAFFEGCQ